MLRSTDPQPLQVLMETVDGALDSIGAAFVARIAYDNTFGICDHSNPSKEPLSLIKHHSCENYYKGNRMHQRMLDFAKYKVHERYGYNFQEWLQQPTYIVELQLEDCKMIYKASTTPPPTT